MASMNGMMWIGSDPEPAGVFLVCDHADHRPQTVDDMDRIYIAYHAGDGPEIAHGKPYFDSAHLAEFLAFITEHAAAHEEDE
jgi:hypothetical protein